MVFRMGYLVEACLLALSLSLAVVITHSAPESALVTSLPGFNGTIPSKHYAGYVTIDKNQNKNLWYYFVESERNPSKDPVVLWLNGGPGCSSMDGFVYEHGPFNFKLAEKNGSLPEMQLNPYTWAKVSNIIYLDSPVGVGNSYSKNQKDYVTNDTQTAMDTHAFLLKWFEMFLEFQSNPFYLSGESFAGIYVPTLASEIVDGIKNDVKPIINLKGYMLGNPVTDPIYDESAMLPFVHGMGLISDDLFMAVTNSCGLIEPNGTECALKWEKVYENIDGLNRYNILEPCYHKPSSLSASDMKLPQSFLDLGQTERLSPVRKRMFGRSWPLRAPVLPGRVPSWPELAQSLNGRVINPMCIDDREATMWLNDPTVRKAIHVKESSEIGNWSLCTALSYDHDTGSMIRFHDKFTRAGFRVLIFSGDHDMCVPFTGSESWTRNVGEKIIDEWRPWMSNGQVAGYTQGYTHNLTFLTIKGAGHTVPEYKPRESLDFYSRFLAGEKI